MAGAQAVLGAAGCALVGGHSCEGAELALGFTVTGHAAEEALMRKGGLRAGQALLLTKPLGTGLLLKAGMVQRAKARWVAGALDAMQESNGPAASVAAAAGVRACTDVTGFGLVGHVGEMAAASGVCVHLDAAAVPLLEGVREVLAAGVRSSLHAQNARVAALLTNTEEALALPLWPALVDPQTAGESRAGAEELRCDEDGAGGRGQCLALRTRSRHLRTGGLLFGVEADSAAALVAALRAAGCTETAIIGHVTACSDDKAVQRITCR